MKEEELIKPAWEYMKYLGDENILEIINKEFDKFIAGEENTREAIFICNCANLVANLNSHFNLLINGESSVGKSWVTKKVLEMFPEQIFSENTYRTRISPKALTYWHNSKNDPEWTWDGKTLYLEDISNDVLNCDVFKVMTSEGSVATIVGKSKNKDSELPTTYDIKINGKPTIVVTTAQGTPIEEIKNRFLIIDLDESKEQTERIMEMQLSSSLNKEKEKYNPNLIKSLSYLKRVRVLLPNWIKAIPSILPRKEILRWRREFPRFLDIIKCSCALHQYQRVQEEGFYKATGKDYDIARRVIAKISASSGIEGLNHREKKAYEYLKEYYKKFEKGCTAKEIYAFKPIYTDRYWFALLERLAGKGLLRVNLEENPDTKRKASYYYPVEFDTLSLPNETELIELIDKMLYKANQGINPNSLMRNVPPISSISSVIENYGFSEELVRKSGIEPELIEKTILEVEKEKNEQKDESGEKDNKNSFLGDLRGC